MSWNYRVFQTQFSEWGGEILPHYTIRDAYYTEAGVLYGINASASGAAPSSTSVEGLQQDLRAMADALTRPVLTPHDIPGYVYDPGEVPLPPDGGE
jgi:hypothetical protein